MTLAVSGTGSAGMEAAVVNLIEPGDSMVVCVNGVFGGRMVDVAERAGAKVTKVEQPWGEVFTPDDLKQALAKAKPKVVGIVMAETSTGAWQPIEEISKLVHDAGALLLVDAVTALGGVPVEVDKWHIDAIYSGTQKCLSCPPGLAPVSFSPRAMDVILARKTKVQSWYLDVTMLAKYWGKERVYHHTAPINMTYAPVRGAAAGARRGARGVLRPAPAQSPGAQGRPGGDGHRLHGPRGASTADAQRGAHSRGRRRRRDPRRAAEPLRHRDRRRPGRLQRQGLADRPDGLRLAREQRAACCWPPSNNCWPSRGSNSTHGASIAAANAAY